MAAIDVFADVWCPFAHVGLRTVFERRSELGRDDLTVRVRARPLELVNGKPLDVVATASHIEELREQVAPNMFVGFNRSCFPLTTLPALALASAAYRKDDRTGEAVSLALRHTLFEEGRDTSDPDVLGVVAQAHGLGTSTASDTDLLLADWHEGEERGVKGSPHFFCRDVESFCPSLLVTRDDEGRVHLQRNVGVLDAFLEKCFASV